MINFAIVVLNIAGLLFPGFLITAVRSGSVEKSETYTILSCLCFAVIVFLMAALINS